MHLKPDQRCDARLLLRQLHWLPVESRLRLKIALLTYNVRSTSVGLSSIITTKRSTGYSRRSSSAPQLTVPRVTTEFALRVAAPQICNDLPVNVQSSPSVHVFKTRLKTFLLNCASELTAVVWSRGLIEWAPLHLRIYGAIHVLLLLLFLFISSTSLIWTTK